MLMPTQVTLVPNYLVSDWLNLLDTNWAIWLPGIFSPFAVFLLTKFMRRIPESVLEAAQIDGANEKQMAFMITMSLIKSTIKVSMTFAVIGSLKLFDLIWVLTKGGPLHASEVPSTLMYTTIFTRMEYGSGSAIAVFIVLECLLFYFLIEKFSK